MRTSTGQELTRNIVQECHAQFDKLPKHGKPAKRSNGQAEWTIFAGIVVAIPARDAPVDQQGTIGTNTHQSSQLDATWEIECISLATGSKCLPAGKQSPRGDLLNDCHAEVLARRGFNRWCLEELRKSVEDPRNVRNKFRYICDSGCDSVQQARPLFELVNPGSQFHLYVSQAPCGDATTSSLAQVQSEESRNAFMAGQQTQPKPTVHESTQDVQDRTVTSATGSKRERDAANESTADSPPLAKLQRRDPAPPDLHKSQPGSSHNLGFRRGRIDYDSVGVLRTKPGRVDSEPTLSMSCSDKIARWNILGLNSALVAPLLKTPIYLESIITRELFDANALERALFERIQDSLCTSHRASGPLTHTRRISVRKSEIAFKFSKEAVLKQSEQEGVTLPPVASASSLSWIATEPQTTEVLVNGCKAGASAKKQIQPKSRSRLCKINMFESSVALWKLLSPKPPLVESMTMAKKDTAASNEQEPASITYCEWKRLDKDFTEAKQRLFTGVFQNWVRGDSSLEAFNIHGETVVSMK